MKAKLLLYVFLLTPLAIYAQDVKSVDCDHLKSIADTAYNVFEKELQNGILVGVIPVEYDEDKRYTSLYTFFQNSMMLIDAGCLTPFKRQDVIEKMNNNVNELAAGGVYFFDKQEYEKSTDFLSSYVDFCKSKLASPENQQNELVLWIEYYAVVASVYSANHERTIGLLEKIIASGTELKDTYELKDMYYLLADEYKKMNNSNRFLEVLEAGILRLPKEKAYFTTIIVNHYMESNDYDRAIEHLDRLLKKTRKKNSDYATYINAKANLLTHQKRYEDAELWYKKGLKKHPDNEQLTEGLGVAYALHAQDLKDANNDKLSPEIAQYYKDGAKLLEKYRTLLVARNADSTDQKRVLSYLRNIYYTLQMGDEFDAVDRLYNGD